MRQVIACSDEPIVNIGLQALLGNDPEFRLICVCQDQAEMVHAAAEHQPHILLQGFTADTDMAILAELKKAAPRSAIVLWCREIPAELAHQAMEMGARGFLTTTSAPETLKECLRASTGGEMWMERSISMNLLNTRPVTLSNRQSQLLALLVQGLKNKEIATILRISEGTVKAYLTTLFEKVGAKDRFELALFGLKNLRNLRNVGFEPDARMTAPMRSVVTRRTPRRPVA
jgi:two-component system nitrate/nitrite response regulator NarL